MSRDKAFELEVEERSERGTRASRRLRREGWIPAVVYGHGSEGRPIRFHIRQLAPLEHHRAGLLRLVFASGGKPVTAILKEEQRDPITGHVLHVDFQEVKATETITTVVPIEPVGDPVGRQSGGELEQVLHELEIRCRPGDLPEAIRVDVSQLGLDESLHVGDLELPEGVSTTVDPEVAVFHVRLPRVMAAEAETGEAEGEAAEGEAAGEEGGGAESGPEAGNE